MPWCWRLGSKEYGSKGWGMEKLYHLRVTSQYHGVSVALGSDHHKGFLVFFVCPINWEGRGQGLKQEKCPPSSLFPSSLSLCWEACSGDISQCTLGLPLPEPQWIFLGLSCENAVGFLEVKPMISGSQEFLTLMLVHTQPPSSCQK